VLGRTSLILFALVLRVGFGSLVALLPLARCVFALALICVLLAFTRYFFSRARIVLRASP
jgi:hypothetical protein